MPVKNAFLAGVLAHVPEADRGKAEAELIALEEGNLRQADYSRVVSEAQAAKEKFDELYLKNKEWYDAHAPELAELDTLRTKVTELEKHPLASGDPPKIPTDVLTKAEFDKAMALTEQGAVGFIAEANVLALKHFKEFGEVLNIRDLLADKRVQEIGLSGVYADKFKEQLKAKADAAEAARVDAIRKEERTKVLAEVAGSHHPYPVVGNEPSSLDAIEATRTGTAPTVKTVDDMAAEYARLGAVRVGSPS